jgi:hypothetical protein
VRARLTMRSVKINALSVIVAVYFFNLPLLARPLLARHVAKVVTRFGLRIYRVAFLKLITGTLEPFFHFPC